MSLHGLARGEFGFRTIEGTSGRWACLRRGDCDAVVLGQPQDLIAMEQGFRMLGASTEAVPELLYTVTAARRSWAEANKDAVVRYVRGLAAAFAFIRDPAHRERVVRTVMQSTNASEAIAHRTLALFLEPDRGVLPKQAEIDVEGLAQVIAMMGEAGAIKSPLPSPEQFVDLQYLRAAGVQ
jgi:ABC-type nitrate/sulfonate/bicarbonate transport system substrate-binding protein